MKMLLVAAFAASMPTIFGQGSCHDPGDDCVATNEVEVVDYQFMPACIIVSPGDTVVWKNQPGASPHHTVTSYAESPEQFDSGELGDEGMFRHTFRQSGQTDYYCEPHEKMGMVGTVKVE